MVERRASRPSRRAGTPASPLSLIKCPLKGMALTLNNSRDNRAVKVLGGWGFSQIDAANYPAADPLSLAPKQRWEPSRAFPSELEVMAYPPPEVQC
jgi:hypothetical protein